MDTKRLVRQAVAWLLCLATIKAPLGVPVYLNGLLPYAGALGIVIEPRIPRVFLIALLLPVLGSLLAIGQGDVGSAMRCVQLALSISAAIVVRTVIGEHITKPLLWVFVPLAVGVFMLETVVLEPLKSREILGFSLPRYLGLFGEPNYNASLYGVVGLWLVLRQHRVVGLVILAIAMASASRGYILGIAVFVAAILVARRGWSSAALTYTVGTLLAGFPLFLLLLDSLISEEAKDWLVVVSSRRYGHWMAYVEMGLRNPFGVGYFNGETLAGEYLRYTRWQTQQAHSVFLQVWSEFGIAGYAIFCLFLQRVGRMLIGAPPEAMALFLYVLATYSVLNALSEWGFWVGIGLSLVVARIGSADGYGQLNSLGTALAPPQAASVRSPQEHSV